MSFVCFISASSNHSVVKTNLVSLERYNNCITLFMGTLFILFLIDEQDLDGFRIINF